MICTLNWVIHPAGEAQSALVLFAVVAVRLAELLFLQEFVEDVRAFQLKVDDADRRLGAIFCQAFDDASGLEHAFKVWELTLFF